MDRVKVEASKKVLASVIGALGRALRDAESSTRGHRRLATSEARWRKRFEDKLAKLGHRWNYDVVWDEEPGDRGWIVERTVVLPSELSSAMLASIQQHSGERGYPETAEETLKRLVSERDEFCAKGMSDAKLLGELFAILREHAGETGESEGAVDILNRLICERDEATKLVERHHVPLTLKKPARRVRRS